MKLKAACSSVLYQPRALGTSASSCLRPHPPPSARDTMQMPGKLPVTGEQWSSLGVRSLRDFTRLKVLNVQSTSVKS